MIEVVFNDSEKATLNIDRKFNIENGINYGENNIDEIKDSNIVNIGFALDIGDISGEVDGSERREVFSKLWGRFCFTDEERDEFFLNQSKDMNRLIESAKSGIPIRIWKSKSPYSMCGYYYVCHLLRDIDCSISIISLPDYEEKFNNKLVEYSGWGEIEPENIHKYLHLEKTLSYIKKIYNSRSWEELIKENATLRASVNGRLLSVEEDFYDFIIERNIPDDDFSMGRLIGKILGECNLGISDSWCALRIDKMIEDKRLILVEDLDRSHPYGKILRRA